MKDIAIYRAIGLMTYTINPLYSYLAVFIVSRPKKSLQF